MGGHNVIRFAAAALLSAAAIAPVTSFAAQPGNLDQLLEETRQARAREDQVNRQREQQFLADRNRQAQLMADAERERNAQQGRAAALTAQYDANEKKLTELQAQLDAKGGDVKDIFGVVRQIAGDVTSVLYNSSITAQFPERDDFVKKLSEAKALPSLAELEQLWFEMQREMTETGRTARFTAKVVEPDGTTSDRQVVRVGPFTAVHEDKFLSYLPSVRALQIQKTQPPGEYRSLAEDVFEAQSGYVHTVVDPSRGVLLSLISQRPGWVDRIFLGHKVGWLILAVGVIGALLAIYQFLYLLRARAATRWQLRHLDDPRDNNPLGRVLASFRGDANRVEEDAEVIELRISEAVLREVPALERFQAFLRLAVAAGPLLGLVGTVIGMIMTFQSITESGSGDPRLMADGISTAMIATLLGLGIAVPLLFINSALAGMSKQIVQILDEQSAGLLAQKLEAQRGG